MSWKWEEIERLARSLGLEAIPEIEVLACGTPETPHEKWLRPTPTSGLWDSRSRLIEIRLDGSYLRRLAPTQLPTLKSELNATLIHELRHVHQYQEWPSELRKENGLPRLLHPTEFDAYRFEYENQDKWDLVSLTYRPTIWDRVSTKIRL